MQIRKSGGPVVKRPSGFICGSGGYRSRSLPEKKKEQFVTMEKRTSVCFEDTINKCGADNDTIV